MVLPLTRPQIRDLAQKELTAAENSLHKARQEEVGVSTFMGRMWSTYKGSIDGFSFLKSMARLTNATSFFAKYFELSPPKALTKVGDFAKRTKNLMSIVEIPSKLESLWNKFTGFKWSEPVRSTADLGESVCNLVNVTNDSAEFISSVATPIPSSVLSRLNGLNYGATFLGNTKGSIDTVINLADNMATLQKPKEATVSELADAAVKRKASQQIVSNLLGLVSKVSYVALGVIGLVSLGTPFGQTALCGALLVGCMTNGTIFSLLDFFWDRALDPSGKVQQGLSKNPHFLVAAATRDVALAKAKLQAASAA